MTFDGFPEAALDFYDDLEIDNSKVFWEAHKDTYATAVRAPMTDLMAELADEFGAAKIFRPHRDVRFSKDKTPYKTHQGAFIATAPATSSGASSCCSGRGRPHRSDHPRATGTSRREPDGNPSCA